MMPSSRFYHRCVIKWEDGSIIHVEERRRLHGDEHLCVRGARENHRDHVCECGSRREALNYA